ncbi:hypothetical protein PUR61_00570 [Streptomyces sp. BE20]|nr:hypothetical protein [Streptomyces sp. BE20]MEE1820709.1 hypothetical protein [Streptomyces sp. BE20]
MGDAQAERPRVKRRPSGRTGPPHVTQPTAANPPGTAVPDHS